MVRIRAQEVLDCGSTWNSIGPPSMADVAHSITILNRLVTWTDRGIELEADPRHVDLLLNEVGCEGAKVTTPLVEERVEEAQSCVGCIAQQVCD